MSSPVFDCKEATASTSLLYEIRCSWSEVIIIMVVVKGLLKFVDVRSEDRMSEVKECEE